MNDRLIYRAFHDADDYIADMHRVYREIYDLPTVSHTETVTDAAMFEYCRKRQFFLIVLPYTSRGQVLLSPTFNDSRLSWRMVSGGVKSSFTDDFITACERHVDHLFPGVELGELEPVAFLRNKYSYETEIHEHHGIMFIARVRNENAAAIVEQMPQSHGYFLSISMKGFALQYSNHQRLFELAVPKIRSATSFPLQEHELTVNQQYKSRYRFHDTAIKPLLRLVSKVYREPISELEKTIDGLILTGKPNSILDIACGDNLDVVKLVRNREIPLYVGNDISWSQIDLVRERLGRRFLRNSRSFALYTNHDARRLPFRDKAFDSVICKNALHHMPDRASVQGLIAELRRVGIRSIIVEVLDPEYENGIWPFIKDFYYKRFLHDAGENFLSRDEFDALTAYPDRGGVIEIKTVKGIYQLCSFGPEELSANQDLKAYPLAAE
jgi:ubiquinone/menaquinone biosynthesis C-methylase UbiE